MNISHPFVLDRLSDAKLRAAIDELDEAIRQYGARGGWLYQYFCRLYQARRLRLLQEVDRRSLARPPPTALGASVSGQDATH